MWAMRVESLLSEWPEGLMRRRQWVPAREAMQHLEWRVHQRLACAVMLENFEQ